jgi:hypothetical protein
MSIRKQARIVGSNIATGPTRTLIQELDVIFERRFDFHLSVVLNPSLPVIGDKPTSNKIVVVRIQLEVTPHFSLEAFKKQGALQDLRPEGARASGHTRCSPINTVSCRDFKVAPLDICCSQPIVDSSLERPRSESLDSLARTNTADFRVLERR